MAPSEIGQPKAPDKCVATKANNIGDVTVPTVPTTGTPPSAMANTTTATTLTTTATAATITTTTLNNTGTNNNEAAAPAPPQRESTAEATEVSTKPVCCVFLCAFYSYFELWILRDIEFLLRTVSLFLLSRQNDV